MRISLDGLQVLDAIQRKGSFAAAAAELHRVPSAITYTIQQLEQDLDVQLFDRSKHRASLTSAGYELLTEGRLLLRAAGDIENRIKLVAKGWETELRIAVDTVIGVEKLFPLIKKFAAEKSGTRIRLTEEVLGGSWDALVSQRADLVLGASGDIPSGGSYATLSLGRVRLAFMAAPKHPICNEKMPLTESVILKYRAISVADSSRNLPPRTVGLISGQDVLTVPSMRAKIAAQVAGLGVGYLPPHMAMPEIAAKQLRVLNVISSAKYEGEGFAAWRPNRTGKALRWFAKALEDKKLVASFLA
jgi:DNA-binding transcriptional LysR family regulator